MNIQRFWNKFTSQIYHYVSRVTLIFWSCLVPLLWGIYDFRWSNRLLHMYIMVINVFLSIFLYWPRVTFDIPHLPIPPKRFLYPLRWFYIPLGSFNWCYLQLSSWPEMTFELHIKQQGSCTQHKWIYSLYVVHPSL